MGTSSFQGYISRWGDFNSFHTDGTGGPGEQPHGIRRVAAVAVFADVLTDSDQSAIIKGWRAVASRVPGGQTSQWAEVQALVIRAQEYTARKISWGTV